MCFVVTVRLLFIVCLCLFMFFVFIVYVIVEGYAQGDKIADKLDVDGFPSIGTYLTEGDPFYR